MSETKPLISVIVPCKGAGSLRACLESLDRQEIDGPYEIIVVDGWHDDQVAAVAAEFSKVRLVRSTARLVPGPARNLGAQHAKSDYLAFTDADCIAEPTFLAAAKAALDRGARLAGGPILDMLPFNPVAVTDNYSQFADFPPTRPEGEAEFFPGCNMAIRKEDFFEIGGFKNTRMPAGEDTLLCFDVADRWPGGVRFVPDMRILHEGRTDFRTFLKHQELFGFCRGSIGIKIAPWQRTLGRSRLIYLPLILKRLSYMLGHTIIWNPLGLVKVALISPLLLAGMLAFASGFRRACRSPMTKVA